MKTNSRNVGVGAKSGLDRDSVLKLAGSGKGMWGRDSAQTIAKLRDGEWVETQIKRFINGV